MCACVCVCSLCVYSAWQHSPQLVLGVRSVLRLIESVKGALSPLASVSSFTLLAASPSITLIRDSSSLGSRIPKMDALFFFSLFSYSSARVVHVGNKVCLLIGCRLGDNVTDLDASWICRSNATQVTLDISI